jgi:nucleolar pre-ribosomal-associated protein 2
VKARHQALILAARSLEQDSSRAIDEKITQLWPILSSVKDATFCPPEENILRWLLKQMDARTETAEQVRRYPLAWTIMGCLLERISLFTLSKIFLERRFLVVLQFSAKDISQPQEKATNAAVNGVAASKKRKRVETDNFDIEYLRTPQACMKSATEMFKALERLMTRVEGSAGRIAEDVRTGAEHVKSLFKIPTKEAQDLVQPLLRICGKALRTTEADSALDQRNWMEILTSIWDLHAESKDDSYEFATHLYLPSCVILSRLKEVADVSPVEGSPDSRLSWVKRLERFLMKNVLRPARTGFVNNGDLQLLKIANIAAENHAQDSARVLWDLAVRTRRNLDDPVSKRAYTAWAQAVFDCLLESLRSAKSADENILALMLEGAAQSETIPKSETLLVICTEYALRRDYTDLDLLGKIIRCDADVFVSDRPLLTTLLDRITLIPVDDNSKTDMVVSSIINPLMEAFSRARDLSEFLKLWYTQLLEIEKTSVPLNRNIWFHPEIRVHVAKLMEHTISPKELNTLLGWLESNQTQTSGSSLVLLDALSNAITHESYTTAAGLEIFVAASRGLGTTRLESEVSALRWRVIGRTTSWLGSDNTHEVWDKINGSLSEILKTGSLTEPITFEAFCCCCKLYLANHPMGLDELKLAKITCAFLQRLVEEVEAGNDSAEWLNYISFTLTFLPRLAELPSPSNNLTENPIIGLISLLFSQSHAWPRSHPDEAQKARGLLEAFICRSGSEEKKDLNRTVIESLLVTLENEGDKLGWTLPLGVSVIPTLLSIESELLDKDRRKRIMLSWKKQRSAILEHASTDVRYSRLILCLLATVMEQPTFYAVGQLNWACSWSQDLTLCAEHEVC